MNKKQLSFILLTIQPSLLSGVLTGLLGGIILLSATLSYGARSGVIYDFLFGPSSSAELIQTSRGSLSIISNTIFGNPTLNKILFFIFWMLIGLCVYIVLYGIIRGTSTAVEDYQESQNVNINKRENLDTIRSRLTTRLMVLASWLLYMVFFIKIFLPFSILSARIGVDTLPTVSGWLYSLLGLMILFLGLHLHVVLLRLFLLRLRIFNSEEIEEVIEG